MNSKHQKIKNDSKEKIELEKNHEKNDIFKEEIDQDKTKKT